VFCSSEEDAQRAVNDLQEWLARRGLELSKSKTRVVYLTAGFDFLGFNVRLYKERDTAKYKLLIKPNRDSVKALKARLRSEWMSLRGANAAAVVARLNPIIRGWANYFKVGVASKTFHDLDNFMFQRCVRWAKWTHPHKPWYFRKEKYWGPLHRHRKANWVFGDKLSGAHLIKFGWTRIERHIKVKGRASKDDPTLRDYWLAREAKATKLNRDKRMLASIQKNRCPVCGDSLFNGEPLHEHHVILDKSSSERTSPHYRKLVHLFCHQQIHLADRKKAPAAARRLLQ
jgi:RNA-directed DNA polymerase